MEVWVVECDEHGYLGSWGTLAEAIARSSDHCNHFGESEAEVEIYRKDEDNGD
jgi:hypothetical protein